MRRNWTLRNYWPSFFSDAACWPLNTSLYSTDFKGNDPKFVYYLLKTIPWRDCLTASAVPGINRNHVHLCPVCVPDHETQTAISGVLGLLDNKIELNTKLNGYLLDLATAQFEAALKERASNVRLGDIIGLEDSKRVPLNSRDRESRKGPYPYYGATSIMDYVNDYLFDGVRVLLGEDGSVIDSEGKPVLQYVWGRYWVNNHAHILKAAGAYPLEAIYVALRRTSIGHIVTGAVQMKISQRNLKKALLDQD